MAYFDCIVGGSGKGNTLVVTCADELAGATITCTNGTKTYTKTCPSTSPYEVTFYGLAAGTWTVSATVSGNTYTTTVVVTDYEAELGGFNWRAWVDLSKNYTSSDFADLNELLDTELAVRELMSIHACVDYLAGIATESADVETIIGNDLAAKWINLRDYALDTLYANEIIAGYMNTADKYFYGEWALMPQVPKMTSNTAPYGEAGATSVVSSTYAAYHAFDNTSTAWSAGSTANAIVYYHFPSPIKINSFKLTPEYSGGASTKTWDIVAKNDNDTDWTTLYSGENTNSSDTVEAIFENSNTYSYYGIRVKTTYRDGSFAVNELQFYAWQPKGNVPIMTSNNAPYGEASASSAISDWPAYKAFDGNLSTVWNASSASYPQHIQYKSVNPICVKRFHMKIRSDAVRVQTYKIQGSNDGFVNDTHDLTETITATYNADGEWVDINNNNFYLYHRVLCLTGNYTVMLEEVQFYGRELSVSVPVMTSNTTPYGEVTVSSYYPQSQFQGFHAFDATENGWNPASSDEYNSANLVYKFTTDIVPVMFGASGGKNGSDTDLTTIKLLVSKDGATYTDTNKTVTINKYSATRVYDTLNLSDSYKYCKFLVTQGVSIASAWGFKFFIYGKDYSEKEFEEGTTKKWLYDHGVKIVDFGSPLVTGSPTVIDSDNQIGWKLNPNATNSIAFAPVDGIDLTSYSLMRCKIGNIAVIGNSQYGYIGVKAIRSYDSSDYTMISSRRLVASDVQHPNDISLDISSVNQTAYPILGDSTSGDNRGCTFKELWLE